VAKGSERKAKRGEPLGKGPSEPLQRDRGKHTKGILRRPNDERTRDWGEKARVTRRADPSGARMNIQKCGFWRGNSMKKAWKLALLGMVLERRGTNPASKIRRTQEG